MEVLYCFRSRGNPQARNTSTGLNIAYLQTQQLERYISLEHYYYIVELQVEYQVKDGSAASIWFHFSVMLYPPMISSTGEKWQGLILVLCQKKSSESEHSLLKRFSVNYSGFFPPLMCNKPSPASPTPVSFYGCNVWSCPAPWRRSQACLKCL